MKIHYMLFVVLLVFFLTAKAHSNVTRDFTFSSHIIFSPIVELAKSKNTKMLNRRTPTKVPEFKIHMTIENLKLRKKERAEYDNALQISFKEIRNAKILIFKKNSLIRQIHILDNSKKGKTVTQYKRNIDNLLSKAPKENDAYFEKTKEVLLLLLKQDDFLADLPLGEHILTCKFRLLDNVVIGDIDFDKKKYNYRFQSYKEKYEHGSLAFEKPLRILFMISFLRNYIGSANLFDEKILNGFEAYFYPNQGLKWLTNLKNGKQEDVTIWSMNGESKKKMPFDKWAKMAFKIKKPEGLQKTPDKNK